jgi:hypothetical protein
MSSTGNRTGIATRSSQALLALAGAYFAALVAVALLRATVGAPHVADVASSPDAIAHGRIWTLATSALIVSGPPALEIPGVAVVAALLIRRHGPATFWRAALAGHIGSAVLAYAIVGIVAASGAHLAHHVLHTPDYGVSCVWGGVIGALGVSFVRRLRRRGQRLALRIVAASYVTLGLLALVIGSPLLRAEHILAVLLGAVVMLRATRAQANT